MGSSRKPMEGDAVKALNGKKRFATSEKLEEKGWILEKGDVAIVVAVDKDSDFKLKNKKGVVSTWLYRKLYEYVEAGDNSRVEELRKVKRIQQGKEVEEVEEA